MATTSFSQRITDARLMSAGIRAHSEELKSISLGEDMAAKIDAAAQDMQKLDTEQERLKSELKAMTEKLNARSSELISYLRDSKKRVKIAIPQTNWKEFGITDKR